MKLKQFTFLLLGLISLTFYFSIGGGCKSGLKHQVSFEELLSNPVSYNGKEIVLEGFYFHGFEIQVLAENLRLSGFAEDHLVPDGNMLWVNGSIPINIYNGLNVQSMMGPEERYGKVRITGRFEYGSQYGHLSSYGSQITLSKLELLEWTP